MTVFLRKFFPICMVTFSISNASPHEIRLEKAATSVDHRDYELDQQHVKELEIITKIILLLKKTEELKCSAEEKVLVNRLLDAIANTFPMKSYSDVQNCEVANKLRMVAQILGISSPVLDAARGETNREETDAIIHGLQKCLAERNLTETNRIVRSIIDRIDPYKYFIAVGTLPFIAYAAYRLHGTMQRHVVTALTALDPSSGKHEASSKTEASAKTKSDCSADAVESWKLFSAILIAPPVLDLYKHVKNTVLSPAVERGSDYVKQMWTKLRGLPFSPSNPAVPSKEALKDVPAPAVIKDHLRALARMTLAQEAVYKQKGGTGLKTLLIHGDTTLANLLASGLAHEIVRLSKENGAAISCPVAFIHSTKLVKEPFKDILTKITNYNEACIIVIQDIDWVSDSEAYSTIVRELISGIKSAARLHEQYIVIATARNLEHVDPVLKQPSIFGTTLSLHPAHDPELLKACVERAEQLYGITITQDSLRARLEEYIGTRSFGAFMNLFAAAYTKSLPQVCGRPFDEYAIAQELVFAEPTRLVKKASA